ncbi:hypothetical protein P152DRAFT_131315 [Eremomyces bilateralis CBS 781.70]|uniref:Uncharacterized protein n=1 Tax=Eremomyces bilateralis CBS 781.70 TaxID=1392243 RepID=A0A6G1GFF2_9PEZI|nr:uncharacterized protein P152DRAFT_131315 [Eremomyces bilateralis CBS 781.70]KAF1816646.1 hypothetical protein P152DRAFT_131315 [Eremomyces bilateralis CBS 781.70]
MLTMRSIILLVCQIYQTLHALGQVGRDFDPDDHPAAFFLQMYFGAWQPFYIYNSGWRSPEQGSKHVSLQFHLRLLSRDGLPPVYLPTMAQGGISSSCIYFNRFEGSIPSPLGGKKFELTEARLAVLLNTTLSNRPLYAITLLDDFRICTYVDESDALAKIKSLGFKVPGAQTGIAMFLAMLHIAHFYWAMEWGLFLDAMDTMLDFGIHSALNPEDRRKLMFDRSLTMAESYFAVLQTLRVCKVWIQEVPKNLADLKIQYTGTITAFFPTEFPEGEHAGDIDAFWEKDIEDAKTAAEPLLARVTQMEEDVKSLRDGLMSTTQLLEATRASTLNQYILVFTFATIFYLPLGFVAAIFGMHLFDHEDASRNQRSFYITTALMAVVTYAFAALAIVGIRHHDRSQQTKPSWSNSVRLFVGGLWKLFRPQQKYVSLDATTLMPGGDSSSEPGAKSTTDMA